MSTIDNRPDPRSPGQANAAAATAPSSALARPPLNRWRTVDLITAAMLGVAFGVVFWGWDFAYNALSPLTKAFPPASGVLVGPWLLAGVVGGLVVRRPGAALLAELVAANVEYLIGNQWGASTLISGALQGLGVEIALAVFLFRRFGPWVAALGGVLAAALEIVYEWFAYYPDWTWGYKAAYLGTSAVSGAVVAGLLGWVLVRALAATGALSAFPPGRDHREAHAV